MNFIKYNMNLIKSMSHRKEAIMQMYSPWNLVCSQTIRSRNGLATLAQTRLWRAWRDVTWPSHPMMVTVTFWNYYYYWTDNYVGDVTRILQIAVYDHSNDSIAWRVLWLVDADHRFIINTFYGVINITENGQPRCHILTMLPCKYWAMNTTDHSGN